MAKKVAKSKTKPNWIKIRTEYEAYGISYRKLAEKYNISENTLEARARREEWSKGKKKISEKITEKMREKIVEKIVDKNSVLNEKHNETWELLHKQIKETLQRKPTAQNPVSREIQEYDYLPKDFNAISKALDKIQKGQRLANEVLTRLEAERLDIEKQRLSLEREKLLLEQSKINKSTDTQDIIFEDLPTKEVENG